MANTQQQAARSPQDYLDSLEIGKKAVMAGETERGIEIYQSILEVYPDNKIARERIRKLGARPEIKPPKLSKKRLAPIEKVKDLMVNADSGKSLEALSGLEELVPQFPRDSVLYFLMGNIQQELGRVTASVASYERSIELNPRYSDTHMNLGRSYFSLRNLKQARASLEKAVELDRRNHLAFYHLGLLNEELAEVDFAIESYFRALRIAPDHPDSNNNLGKIFLVREEPKRASKLFEKAISSNRKHTQALVNLGIAQSRLGLNQEAIESLSKALDLQPNHSEAIDLLEKLPKKVGNA